MSVSPAVGVWVGGAGRLPLDGHPSPRPPIPAYAEGSAGRPSGVLSALRQAQGARFPACRQATVSPTA